MQLLGSVEASESAGIPAEERGLKMSSRHFRLTALATFNQQVEEALINDAGSVARLQRLFKVLDRMGQSPPPS